MLPAADNNKLEMFKKFVKITNCNISHLENFNYSALKDFLDYSFNNWDNYYSMQYFLKKYNKSRMVLVLLD